MSDLRERISRGDILIMDGGVSTEIERKGVSMRKMSRIVARRRQAIVRIPEKLSGVQRKNQGSCEVRGFQEEQAERVRLGCGARVPR